MPKKKAYKDKVPKARQDWGRGTSDMLLKMASNDLSPVPTKRRTLKAVVDDMRQRSPISPTHRLITAIKQASSRENVLFTNDRLSRKVTESLSPQDIRDLRLVFEFFDVDKSGFMDYDELRKACKMLGFTLGKVAIKKFLAEVDIDRFGQIDFNEFLEFIISRQGDDRDIFSEISQGFKIFDHDNSGKITLHNLKWASKETGIFLSDMDLKGMIYQADKDGDDEIDLDEFISVMLQTNLFL